MAEGIDRIVDAHVHHWDVSRAGWYPYVASDDSLTRLGLPDGAGMPRVYGQADYLGGAARWNIDKYVHVTAASPPFHMAETAELEELASSSGRPNAIIGNVDRSLGASEAIDEIQRQCRAPRFRGVRASEGLNPQSPLGRAVLGVLQERGLIYELLTRPHAMVAAAAALERFESLTIIVEHAGMPLSSDPDHVRLWREGMRALAGIGTRVHCKLSGLSMTVGSMDENALRPWIEQSLEIFGVDRCLFASNFPVDMLFGTFDDLYSAYDRLTASLSDDERARLFAGNAEKLYCFDAPSL